MVKKKFISVFIPTYNGLPYITESVNAVLHQNLPEGYDLELLIIDSGSTDGTIEALKSFKKRLTLIEIPNSEFSHGGTRDKAARLAKGDFVLFLSQDATPTNYNWIINMIEPFFLSDHIGCVYGRQVPRPDAAATIKREVSQVFGGLGAPDSIVVRRYLSLVTGSTIGQLNAFFSDVNSASRKELLTGNIPYRQVHYAEDQALATDMQNAGYAVAYVPLGEVWHSNEYTAYEYYQRKFDEFIGLQESVGTNLKPSIRSLALGWIRPTLKDWEFTRHDTQYGRRAKIKWYLQAPLYNFAEKAGRYMAGKYLNNNTKRQAISLEHKMRNKSKSTDD